MKKKTFEKQRTTHNVVAILRNLLFLKNLNTYEGVFFRAWILTGGSSDCVVTEISLRSVLSNDWGTLANSMTDSVGSGIGSRRVTIAAVAVMTGTRV